MYIYGGRTSLRVFNLENKQWKLGKDDLVLSCYSEEKLEQLLSGHTLSVVGNNLYIFGGRKSTFELSDKIYEIDENGILTVINPTCEDEPPSGRAGHSEVVYEDMIYYYGGSDGVETFNQLFSFNVTLKSWKEVETIGEGPILEGHTSIYGNLMFVFGGRNCDKYNEYIQILNLDTMTWEEEDNLVKMKQRSFHSATLIRNYVYLFGGFSGFGEDLNYLQDIQIFNLLTKQFEDQKVEDSNGPYTRQNHCAVNYNNDVYIFGGTNRDVESFKDMYQLETSGDFIDHENGRTLGIRILEFINEVEKTIIYTTDKTIVDESFMNAVSDFRENIIDKEESIDFGKLKYLKQTMSNWEKIGDLCDMAKFNHLYSDFYPDISDDINKCLFNGKLTDIIIELNEQLRVNTAMITSLMDEITQLSAKIEELDDWEEKSVDLKGITRDFFSYPYRLPRKEAGNDFLLEKCNMGVYLDFECINSLLKDVRPRNQLIKVLNLIIEHIEKSQGIIRKKQSDFKHSISNKQEKLQNENMKYNRDEQKLQKLIKILILKFLCMKEIREI